MINTAHGFITPFDNIGQLDFNVLMRFPIVSRNELDSEAAGVDALEVPVLEADARFA